MLAFYLSVLDNEESKNLVERIYNTYERFMFSVAYKVTNNKTDSEDIVHDSMMWVIKNIDRIEIDFSKKTKALLATIVSHKAIDNIRANKKIQYGEIIENEAEIVNCFEALNTISPIEVKEMIEKLPQDVKNVVSLRFVYGYSASQTADMLDMDENAVYYRTEKARKILKHFMG